MKGKGGMDASETGGTDPEAVVLAGWRAGKPLRGIAAGLYGREEVEACWRDDGAMRSRLRRLLAKAGARAAAGTDTDPGLP